ncbi:MAG TPA: methyltransferase domain-containing protein, partial [Candidatus Dormibacteraeota bacterium]|nr:methyltransferase domain-containing protein [Candidatus Dormibacteraeota bacterium]
LARFYDLDLEADDPGDLDLYLALAARTGGPVLELAAGTGRIAVPLALGGHDVTAVDVDPAMIERGRATAEAAGVADRVDWVCRDLLELRDRPLAGAGSFRLAILALNSLFLLPTPEAQRTALLVLAGHVAPGGLVAVDIWLPSPADLVRYDGRLLLDGVHADGDSLVTRTWAATHDPATASVVLTTIYEEGRIGEAPVRWVRRDAMRLVSPDELVGWAEAAGLEVEVVGRDHGLEPLGPGADRAVLVARRP